MLKTKSRVAQWASELTGSYYVDVIELDELAQRASEFASSHLLSVRRRSWHEGRKEWRKGPQSDHKGPQSFPYSLTMLETTSRTCLETVKDWLKGKRSTHI